MSSSCSETSYRRVGYGLKANVTIGPGFLHKTGFGGFVIPHPAMANWLLPLGLPGTLGRNLSFAHEFAHFQTAPLLLVYMLVLFILLYIKGGTGIGNALFLLVSGQSAWEMMSEGHVIFEDSAAYRRAYDGVTGIPRLLFWTMGGMVAAAGWMVMLHKSLP